jgi:polysaccharide export outer membrane protein
LIADAKMWVRVLKAEVMRPETNECRSNVSRNLASWAFVALFALGFSALGCANRRSQLAHALGSNQPAPVLRDATVEESYAIGCPDVIEISVDGAAECGGRFTVNAEGRIELPNITNSRVEGETTSGLAQRIARELNVAPEKVRCHVVAHRSREVFVFGPIEGSDRAVAYRGPENIVAFIRRCGGLTPAANVREIHIVRGNVAACSRPQVFNVDLEAILLNGDPKTNYLLQPFDEVYIGELKRAKIGRALPQWMRPVYREFCELFPGACPHDWREQIRDQEP